MANPYNWFSELTDQGRCPQCGSRCDEVYYRDFNGKEVMGCDECIKREVNLAEMSCPVCGDYCPDIFFTDRDTAEIVGCDECPVETAHINDLI